MESSSDGYGGGWNFNVHHRYARNKIYLGNGSVVSAEAFDEGSIYRVVAPDSSEVYYFDTNGRHLTTNEFRTGAVKYTFNYLSNGYLSSIVDAYGNTTSVLRNSSGVLTGIQSPYGRVTTLSLGQDGYLASISNPKGETHSMTYYAGGLLHTFQKPKGQISTMDYDSEGNLILDSSSAGNYTSISTSQNSIFEKSIEIFDALGLKSTINLSQPGGTMARTFWERSNKTTSTNYTPTDGLLESDNAGSTSKTTKYANDPRFGVLHKTPSFYSQSIPGIGNYTVYLTDTVSTTTTPPITPFNYLFLQSQMTVNGKSTLSRFAPSTGVETIESPMARLSYVTSDIFGKPIQTQFANFISTQYSYDTRGRLQFITQGSRQTEIQYNNLGDVSAVKNPLNQTTSFNYDLAGRIQSVTSPDLRTVGYVYDANGNIASITPAGSSAHAFTFNAFDLPSHYNPPTVPTSTPATQYTYDNAKRITQITKPDLSNINFNYHLVTGLLNSVSASGDTTSFVVNADNKITGMVSQDGLSTSQVYSGDWFVSSDTKNSNNINIGNISYAYNSEFLVRNLTVTAANSSTLSVDYTYDGDGIIKAAGSLAYTLDPTTGLVTTKTLNRIQEAYSYDSSYGEPLSLHAQYVPASGTSTPLFSQNYTRDALGRIQTKVETIAGVTNTYGYVYDSSGRLTDVTKNSAAYSHYGFDDNNNLTSGYVAGVAFTATYDAQDRILSYNTNTYAHTPNGELKSKTVGGVSTNFTYNGFGFLKTAKVGAGPILTYLYDGLNRRVGKKSGSTVQKYWVYQDQLRIAAELNSAGTMTKRFIYGAKANVPEYVIVQNVTYKIISDHLGSVRRVVNAAYGSVVQAMDYNERGEVLLDTNPGFQPFGFAGGLYDSDTKLVRFGERDYDPSIGRWLSKDPTLFNGGTPNLYEYAFSDPMSYIDRDGKIPVPVIAFGAGFLIGAASSYQIDKKLNPNASTKDRLKAVFEGGFLTGASTALGTITAVGTVGAAALTAAGLSFNFLTAPGDANVSLTDLSNGINYINGMQQSSKNVNQCPGN